MSGDFDKLMAELGTLQADQSEMTKALPADDGKDDANIQAAAAEGGLDTGAVGAGEGGEDAAKDGEGDGDKPAMAKSFQLTLEDGTVIEAQDGAEMVKALGDRVTAGEANMAKALGGALDLIKGQSTMIKSMQSQIAKLSNEGRGRKAVLSVVEKPAPNVAATTMAKALTPEGMTSDVFFAKAFDAQKAGRISGADIAVAEASLNRGDAIPAHIVQRVMA